MAITKEQEHDHIKETKKEPELRAPDQVLRLVTEVIHDMRPQPDPVIIKDILNALQAKLHEEPKAPEEPKVHDAPKPAVKPHDAPKAHGEK